MKGRIKVQRMDRNGKLVSRWVKPELTKRSVLASVPPVAPLADQSKAELVQGVRYLLEDIMLVRRDGLDDALDSYVSKSELATFSKLLKSGRNSFVLAQQLIKAVENPTDGAALVPRLARHFANLPEGVPADDAAYIMVGMQDYHREFTVEQERALIETTYAGVRSGVGVMIGHASPPMTGFLFDPADLMELVVSRPEDATRIADIIRDHETDEAWKIRQLLDGGLPHSIASGAL